MNYIGTPFSPTATRVLLLGSGELGKELTIELQRLGVEVVAVDNYANAPAMQVAQHSRVIDMTDAKALHKLISTEKPNLIVPEVEAIATEVLLEFEQQGTKIIPSAKAVCLTMNREGIRRLAAETLKLPTSNYRFAESLDEFHQAINELGLPCIVKPIMSSSGKGQTIVKTSEQIENAWQVGLQEGRTKNNKVMVESFIDFDYEITLLTVRHGKNTSFCQPIGHIQEDGDYQISWQPQAMNTTAKQNAEKIAFAITKALGGSGVFGVELFVKGDQVWFNEVSPRPHDTGMVTLISQNLSEFALHARAILDLPIPKIKQLSPSASKAIVVKGKSNQVSFSNIDKALEQPDSDLRLFGKPAVNGKRRMGVVLAQASDINSAKNKVEKMYNQLKINL